MKKESIASHTLFSGEQKPDKTLMLENEIPGATVFYHAVGVNSKINFPPDSGYIRILFLCCGNAVFRCGDAEFTYDERSFFCAMPEARVDFETGCGAGLLEIRRKLDEKDLAELAINAGHFPITGLYAKSPQYRDPFKSEKTISRSIIHQRLIPRFAMGSVETHGEDLIGQHSHPLLEQFFFSFSENNMILLIDDLIYHMKGNTLLHIPLGSNHGVAVLDNQHAHYLWLDFLLSPDGLDYLDSTHKPTGSIRAF